MIDNRRATAAILQVRVTSPARRLKKRKTSAGSMNFVNFGLETISDQRGLMSSYALNVAANPGDWNLVVVVGYADPRGYDGIAPAFEAIRAAHVTADVRSKHGRIIASRKHLPDSSKALT